MKSNWGLSRNAPYTDVKYVDYVVRDTRRDKDYAEFMQMREDGIYLEAQRKEPFILYKYTGKQGHIGPSND